METLVAQGQPLRVPTKQLPENQDISSRFVKITTLLELDDACQAPHAIDAILGDRYLYTHNRMFSRVRDAALRYGCRFTDQDSPLLRSYIAFSLFSLHKIIDTKTVPYVANTGLLRDLAHRRQNLAVPVRFLMASMRHNYILHESSHLVAHQVITTEHHRALDHCRSEAERFVWTSILTEAFANTVERLASSDPCPLIHVIFYLLNSYMDYRPEKWTQAAAALHAFGLERAFRLAFLSYVVSNILEDPTAPTIRDRVIDLVWGRPLAAEEIELVSRLLESGYRINTTFREETSRSYFRFFGAESSFLALKDMRAIMDDGISEALLRLVSMLAGVALPVAAAI